MLYIANLEIFLQLKRYSVCHFGPKDEKKVNSSGAGLSIGHGVLGGLGGYPSIFTFGWFRCQETTNRKG